MARPFKDPATKMTVDLRIPVTVSQKTTVADAMAVNGQEFAGWARELILTEAQKLLASSSKKTKKRGS